MDIIWKPIHGIELLEGFSASNKGKIRCDKGYKKKGAKKYTYIMEQHLENSSYKYDTYILYKRKKFWVKRLIANAFGLIGTSEKYILKHIDMNPWNNCPENLIYIDTCTNFALLRLDPPKIDLDDETFKEEIEEVRNELYHFLSYRKKMTKDPESRYMYKPKHPLDKGINVYSYLKNLNYYEDAEVYDDFYMNPYEGDV